MKKLSAVLLPLAMVLTGCSDESIGIIGGADGPTEIFVTGVFPWWIVGLIVVIALVVVLIAVWRHKK